MQTRIWNGAWTGCRANIFALFPPTTSITIPAMELNYVTVATDGGFKTQSGLADGFFCVRYRPVFIDVRLFRTARPQD